MAVVAWQGALISTTATTETVVNETTAGGIIKINKLYPFTDPIFQSFTVQQYVTLGSAGPTQTYA